MNHRITIAAGAAAEALGHAVRVGRRTARYVPGWAGALLVSYGAGMVYPPAGVITAGGFLLAADALISRAPGGGN